MMMIFARILPAAFVCCEETKILEKGKNTQEFRVCHKP
jgi:hypothetical protein